MSLNYVQNLSNYDLESILDKLNIPFKNCYSKDELTSQLFTDGYYVINLENHNENGSHWTALIREKNNVFYVDSFGTPPPENIFRRCKQMKLQIFYNNVGFQNIKSNLCGYFCIALFCFLDKHKKKNTFDNIQSYTDMYDEDNTSKNDADRKSTRLNSSH